MENETLGNKAKKSSTLWIVIFVAVNMVSHVVLQFLRDEPIEYLGDLMTDSFLIFMIYLGKETAVKTVKGLRKP